MKTDLHAIKNATPLRKRFLISSRVVPQLLVALDSAVILTSAVITYIVIVGYFGERNYYEAAVAFVWLVSILLMRFAGLYDFEPIMRPLAFSDKIIISFATTFLFLLAAAFSLKISVEYSRIWVTSFAAAACTATIVFRIIAARILGHLADRHVFSRNVVVVGSGEQLKILLTTIDKSAPRFISLLGVFGMRQQDIAATSSYPSLGTFDDLASFIRSNDVDDVIISLPWSADDEISALMNILRELPVNAYLATDLIGFRLPFRPAPDHFGQIAIG